MSITEFLDKLDAGRGGAGPTRRCSRLHPGRCWPWCWCATAGRIVQGSWGNVLTTLEWPMAWQYMPMPVGMGLMMVFVGWDLVLILRGFPREQRYPAD